MIIGAPLSDLITIKATNIWGKLFLSWRLFILDNLFFFSGEILPYNYAALSLQNEYVSEVYINLWDDIDSGISDAHITIQVIQEIWQVLLNSHFCFITQIAYHKMKTIFDVVIHMCWLHMTTETRNLTTSKTANVLWKQPEYHLLSGQKENCQWSILFHSFWQETETYFLAYRG